LSNREPNKIYVLNPIMPK